MSFNIEFPTVGPCFNANNGNFSQFSLTCAVWEDIFQLIALSGFSGDLAARLFNNVIPQILVICKTDLGDILKYFIFIMDLVAWT